MKLKNPNKKKKNNGTISTITNYQKKRELMSIAPATPPTPTSRGPESMLRKI